MWVRVGAEGILYKKGAIYLPDDAALKTEVIGRHYDGPHAGYYAREIFQRKSTGK